ncbi:HPr kinase/phosphorylase [Geminicoccus roseus]|uniref:HPr kinase/phosphorylase n=1 Tax=Geminicoccus roseus TaxID=404900 RepID=UPI00041FB525|nr:hypothetical protein [Geminicoccus roseus]
MLHASCVRLHGRGVLIQGASGTGKSRLCAALLGQGGWLVADDAVRLENRQGSLLAHRPDTIAGHLELRYLGLAVVPSLACTRLHLVVMLTPSAPIERLPAPRVAGILGVVLPLITIAPDAIDQAGAHVPAAMARLIREVP